MKVAMLSDVHGRLRLVLHMLQCWQIAHRAMLDGALVAGDLGCFPDPAKYDRATRRWIERDPEEAGFAEHFTRAKADVQSMLAGTPDRGPFSSVRCPILFAPGNHEDYAFLRECARGSNAVAAPENTFPVDCYEAFHCIRDAAVARLAGQDGTALRVAALWGIEDARPGSPYRISAESAAALQSLGAGCCDLLLTHDVALGTHSGWRGSAKIADILRSCQPPIHLFGHVHPINGQHEYSLAETPTRSWILEGAGFGRDCSGTPRGSLAILDWNQGRGAVSLVEEDWLERMRFSNWDRIWPE